MKLFVIFYLMLGVLTPSIVRTVQQNGISALSPFGPKTTGLEMFGTIALGLLLIGMPLAYVYIIVQDKRAGRPPSEQASSFLVFVVVSYLMGLGFGFYYGF